MFKISGLSGAWRTGKGEAMQSLGKSCSPGRIMVWTGAEREGMWVVGNVLRSENGWALELTGGGRWQRGGGGEPLSLQGDTQLSITSIPGGRRSAHRHRLPVPCPGCG